MSTQVEALIKRNIFASEEEAIQELVRDYVLRQMTVLQDVLLQFERKYGMNFQQFNQYLHERSALLENKSLAADQLQTLSAAVMQEEDDWLDWKASRELLENWLGLRNEVGA
jgi:ABC-type polar amino acid transport system ATPase subunit